MNILVDADALIALYNKNDSNYLKAKRTSHNIIKDHLFISPITIPEGATVLSHKVSQETAIRFIKETRTRKLEEITLSQDLIIKADQIFIDQKNKNTSWPDCLNMAIARDLKIDTIFSFDSIYQKNGFKVLQ